MDLASVYFFTLYLMNESSFLGTAKNLDTISICMKLGLRNVEAVGAHDGELQSKDTKVVLVKNCSLLAKDKDFLK